MTVYGNGTATTNYITERDIAIPTTSDPPLANSDYEFARQLTGVPLTVTGSTFTVQKYTLYEASPLTEET